MAVWNKLILTLRIICLVVCLYTSLNITWQSVISWLALLGSLYLLNIPENLPYMKLSDNPYKGKPNKDEENLPPALIHQTNEQIVQAVTHSAEDAPCLQRFSVVKQNTQCVFAKKARIWGSSEWDYNLSLEENVYRNIPTFYKFILLSSHLGLDGFLVELPGEQYGENIKSFAKAVKTVLKILSDNDPKGVKCMNSSLIGKLGWVFEFNKETVFITTFAPFYKENHPRYAFGSEHCYILFQPEMSFAQHNLSPDTPQTNWENPKTARDRTRVAYKEAGRPYYIRDTVIYPTSHEIVTPLIPGDQVVEWWNM